MGHSTLAGQTFARRAQMRVDTDFCPLAQRGTRIGNNQVLKSIAANSTDALPTQRKKFVNVTQDILSRAPISEESRSPLTTL
jgi:hypothetical protein